MQTIIFGGAFDPPHSEHVNMVREAVRETGAERVVILPTFVPPHKSAGFLSFEERVKLAKAAFCDVADNVIVDEEEKTRGNDNYASFLLPLMKKKYGDIAYLIGGDSLQYFDTWRNPADILAVCPVLVCEREGFAGAEPLARETERRFGGEIRVLRYVGKEVSSGRIKATLLLGESSDDIPAAVADIIRQDGLFAEYLETVEKVKRFESSELYEHSKAALFRAVDLNSAHNLKQNFEKVFLAALLHDNAKERPSVDGLDVPSDSIGTPVLHQFLGAEKARRDFGVTDSEILDAIRYHTTAKPGMTLLEKLIYTADSTSYDREYAPMPYYRALVDADFENGFRELLRYTFEKVKTKGKGVYPLTEEAAKYYL